jgi:threonine dehydratase
LVNLQEIQAAAGRIRDSILVSPFDRSEAFSQLAGNAIFLKLENHQMTGAFKERGALNKILLLTEEERRRGVIAASAGNHAQAVAYHAAKRGIRAQICMPLTTPLVKVSATRGYGAEVILFGANYDEACAEALRRCDAEKLTFIHPFDDPTVIAGQGTLGLEILEQVNDLDVVVVPIGRRRLRGEGDVRAIQTKDLRDWSADVEAAVDESGGRERASRGASGGKDDCRRNRGAQRGRAHVAPGAQVRGSDRDRGR